MAIELGKPARALWSLDEAGIFLNHGSYGACPVAVLWAQDRIRREMERHPDHFFATQVEPGNAASPLRQAAQALAAFAGVDGERVALVENASSGTQCVLQSMHFAPGDEILITDHQYNALRIAVEMRCRETGAVPVIAQIPVPTDAGEVMTRVLDAAGPRVKLAILDHITSPTALVFPVAELAAELRRRGIRVLVDGAHAVGQLPLDIAQVGADWYVTNAHKWLYAPRGSSLLYAGEDVAALTRPLVLSHFVGMGFPRAFDYIGTRDYSPWLALPAALAFFQDLGPERLRAHNAALVKHGSDLLMSLGARPAGPLDMCAAMRAFILPQTHPATNEDADALRRMLWEEERIQVKVDAFFQNTLMLRFSAQAYVDRDDLERLAEVLKRRGWPGR